MRIHYNRKVKLPNIFKLKSKLVVTPKSIEMKKAYLSISVLIIIFTISCSPRASKTTQESDGLSVEFVKDESERKIDVTIDGQLFTSLKWQDGIYKPVLHPIITSSGTIITRGFPLEPRIGERPDHRHHVGNWLNYGDVNGVDFWGNGHGGKRSPKGGEIILLDVEQLSHGSGEGSMITKAKWVGPDGKELLSETTTYHFIVDGATRIIDRITKLTAGGEDISWDDTKEGMFAVRVARHLELPSEDETTILDKEGNSTRSTSTASDGVTGDYISSEGKTGSGVWGTRAKWMNLYGNIEDEKISLVICDHPKNPGYPTYWHARGYGLFSANPFGAKDFTKGQEQINFKIPSGESVTFHYRLIISSNEHLSSAEINRMAEDFAAKY